MTKTMKFGEFASFKYGKMPNKKKMTENGDYPVYSGYRYVGYYDEYNTEANQLIIVARGVGGTGDVKLTKERCYLTNLSIAAEINKEVALPEFLYYYFMPRNLRYLDSGSAQSQITISDLERVEIALPSISEQKEICSYLQLIDEKIKTNDQINDNLEQQAQALFKKMFPYVLEDTASDCFESIISFSNGKKRPQSDGSVPVYGGNGILAYTSEVNANNCVIIGRVGAYCGNTFLCQGNCWVSDNAIQAKSKNEDSQIFVYYLLKNASLPTRHIGTGQPLMTQGILNAIPVSVPEQNAINNFIDNVSPMHKLISANLKENSKLAKIRDILLPQLMSGELDVSNLDI